MTEEEKKAVEFNKLVNTVNSYKGQFKKQQKEIEELKREKAIYYYEWRHLEANVINKIQEYDDKGMTEEEKKAIDLLKNIDKQKCPVVKNNIERQLKIIELNRTIRKQSKIIDEILKTWKQDDVRNIAELKKYFEERCK